MRFSDIIVDQSVEDYPLTSLILEDVPRHRIRRIGRPEAVSLLRGETGDGKTLPFAKSVLMLTRNTGSFFKFMGNDPGITDCQRERSYRFELLQGCPADCCYCFCQSYLGCHHIVVFTNVEDALQQPLPEDGVLVTGDIADSLALGAISIVIHEHIASVLTHARFEIRSKFGLPHNWRLLDPSRFRIDWTMSPESYWRLNESGTASPKIRIASAAKACRQGFSVGIRLDPLQPDRIDPAEYDHLIRSLRSELPENAPDAIILGSYKMSSELLAMIRERFPKNPLPGYEWTRCPDGKIRPFRTNRIASYRDVLVLLERDFPGIPVFLSMEISYILNLLA
ncbi:hypothetical protein JW823_05450 [bacterium]|nr:hypothetical protein [candidate division CSSED10-310 bacterium]